MERYTDEGKYALKDMSAAGIMRAAERLKRYEDTDLLPDEVERMKRDTEKHKGVEMMYEKEIAAKDAEIKRLKEKLAEREKVIAELHANLAKKTLERSRAEDERDMWKSLFEESKQKEVEERKKPVPWLEAALFGSSSVLMGLSWLDLNLWPLLPIYWTLLAGYWGAAIWRRWNGC